jgi:hypothetical protein
MKYFVALILISVSLNTFAARLNYNSQVDLSQAKGTTFFSLMKNKVKPTLDQYASQGFVVADGNQILAALKNVDAKVARKAISAAGGTDQLKQLADTLNARGQRINFYNLPQAIADAGFSQGRYDLSTFLALASGGGVAVKINEQNYAYNVNYGTGLTEKDEMTGRSYGESQSRPALDASDKLYLQSLENYVRTESNVAEFYKSILDILINNDSSHYSKMSAVGQAVATDFLAVYVAEQDRHLMANLKSHHWDDALLQVTLLSALHSGQKNVMVMYNGALTASTYKQAPGCATEARVAKAASMVDYWQFSTSSDPANCNRSGINVTRSDFNRLGAAISSYHRKHNPRVIAQVERHFKNMKTGGNLFAEISAFLINYQTPEKMDSVSLQLSDDFTAFLMQVRQDANTASSEIAANLALQ